MPFFQMPWPFQEVKYFSASASLTEDAVLNPEFIFYQPVTGPSCLLQIM